MAVTLIVVFNFSFDSGKGSFDSGS